MSVDEATRRQIVAARPDASTWLSANAGSGKTRVLTDRVARLLLSGVDPQNILCLTYTKAAASEMQNRLFKRLGAWAMMPDAALIQALVELGVSTEPDLRRARTLFAAAIETPGGLKIQTIHSFCAGLLRRFPVEAGISPNFTEIEDRAADLLRAEVLDSIATGPDAHLVTDLAELVTDEDFGTLTKQISSRSFSDLTLDDALALMGLAAGVRAEDVKAAVLEPGDMGVIEQIRQSMAAASAKTDPLVAEILKGFDAGAPDAFDRLCDFFLTKSGTAKKDFPTKPVRALHTDNLDAFDAIKERVAEARQTILGIAAAQSTVRLHAFGHRFNRAYSAAKRDRGWLDFDDLIEKARALLTDRAVAAWVLFRLDGGIDHILVDEAQDTSPAQWDVIRQLAAEFGTGDGARANVLRTIFVVGDKKQSIYSFQGADPREFDRMQAEFDARISGAGALFQNEELAYSFRSSPGILRLVDQCFEATETVDARHMAFKSDLPGRVDLWPHLEKTKLPDPFHFSDPVDIISPEHHNAILAQRIADRISDILAHETIPDEVGTRIVRRAVEPRDFLILVQGRSGIFPELIRALKAARLPIAGADRLKVGAELAVKDIGALLSFLSTQDDDLALATALRSPLFGWSEAALFDLAHGRGKQTLWTELRQRRAEFPAEMEMLDDLRSNADFLRPYDLMDRILTRHGGRRTLLARLGPEAAEGIDALLGQALDYERTEVPSLTGFLTWLQTDDLDIKRQVDSASNQIRVMTVHGAKGLEAPIVILPDCAKKNIRIPDRIIKAQGVPVWKPTADAAPPVISHRLEEMREEIWQEKLRLLYVALTRAEKWLIVAAAGDLDKQPGKDWFQIVEAAMHQIGCERVPMPGGTGLRSSFGDWDAPPFEQVAQAQGLPAAALFTDTPLQSVPERTEPLTPSDIEGAKALPSPEGMTEADAKAYGTYVHALLEGVPPRAELPANLRTTAKQEAADVMRDPGLARFFAPDTLSEVPFTAPFGTRRLHGIIDKLIVAEDRITIADFKTNRGVPDRPEDVPLGVLRQMGAYLHGVRQIYPDRRIDLVIIWTRTRTAMTLPHEIVTASLSGLPYLDDAGDGS